LEEISNEHGDKLTIVKLNVDENPNTTVKFGVRSIPTLLVFKGGKVVDKQVGAVPKSVLAQKLDTQLA